MPGLTSPQNFPYPLYTELAENGAAQIQALAEAIDNAIDAQQILLAATVERKRAAVSAVANQSIPNNTLTNATFATEDLDNDNMVNLGVDNTAITTTTAGLYLVSANVSYVVNATGSRQVQIHLAGVNVGAIRSFAAPAPSASRVACSMLVRATAGQILRMSLFQTSGGALNATSRQFSAVRLSG